MRHPLLLLAVVACNPADSGIPEFCTPVTPDWGTPITTLTERMVVEPGLSEPTDYDPAHPEGLIAAEAAGLGGWTVEAGDPRLVRDDLAPDHTPGATRRSLAMFLHHSDAQLADAESPTRMVGSDAAGATQSSLRPQELYAVHALDALIRVADAIDASVPIDFAIATGDNTDNVQSNELHWFTNTWDGVPFRPDSAVADTQLDVDCNDPLAPFEPVGANFPWYAVAGNHDVLVQGNFDIAAFVDNALGSDAPLGTRDLSLPGGPLAYWSEPDPGRALTTRSDIAAILLDSPSVPGPAGHGFTSANVTDDTVGWTARPVEGVPVRIISVDANPDSPTDGKLTIAERDTWLVPQLQAAQDADELIIVTSHYALSTLPVEGGGTVGDLLGEYPNVILSVAGHWHRNLIRSWGNPDDPAAFWEIVTASTADWPPQGRLVELVDNGDGTLSVFTTVIDVPAPEGSMAARFRRLAAIDLQTGWRLSDGTGAVEDRNTELIQRLPAGWATTAGAAGVRSAGL